MRLVCIRQFGSFLPGDEYPEEVADDASFDHTYFAAKPSDQELIAPTLRRKPPKEDER
jgi:hypothetical protein